MLKAQVGAELLEASPDLRGICPSCKSTVVAKCGSINIWHWAHKVADCDSWSEPMTQWHLDWQKRFPEPWREVVLAPHRADVQLPNGLVIEFQHSPISVEEIQEREAFYKNMIWIFDAREIRIELTPVEKLKEVRSGRIWKVDKRDGYFFKGVWQANRQGGSWINGPIFSAWDERPVIDRWTNFKWSYPKKSVAACTKPVYLDLGKGNILEMGEFGAKPFKGLGRLVSELRFLEEYGTEDVHPHRYYWGELLRLKERLNEALTQQMAPHIAAEQAKQAESVEWAAQRDEELAYFLSLEDHMRFCEECERKLPPEEKARNAELLEKMRSRLSRRGLLQP